MYIDPVFSNSLVLSAESLSKKTFEIQITDFLHKIGIF